MNVLDLLHQDHETANRLFAQLLSTSSADKSRREELFQTLKSELIRHSHAEEKIFYPPLREKRQSHDMVEEGLSEHHHVEEHLSKIQAIPADSDDFMDQIRKLQGEVQHHVSEEEEEIFPQARQLLGEQTLDSMTPRVEEAKRQEG